ncbi:MAG: CorA family divalent cation transporter [Candidatus Woesearchaeota archaeon]
MFKYLYTHNKKYYSGENASYVEGIKKIGINPKKFSKKELLCFFIQNPGAEEFSQISKDFGIEEKYFQKVKTESRSVRYSFDPLIFCLTDYVTEYGKIQIAHLLMLIKDNVLLLVVLENYSYFKNLFDAVVEKAKKRKLYSETYILYEFLHHDTKENYDVIENIDDKLAYLEKKIIESNSDSKILLQEILSQKKYLIKLNKRLWATSKIIFTIKKDLTALKLSNEEKSLLEDIYDTLMHQIDLIETQKETVTDLLEIYTTTLNNRLAEISNNLNVVMKKMTALTIIIMVPTLVASIYGMNFENMPELKWPLGYAFAIGVMIFLGFSTYYVFHKRDWI